jgi:LPXTG-motif cell wall-anchored protein
MKNSLRMAVVAGALVLGTATPAWAIAYNGEEPPPAGPSDTTPPVQVAAPTPAPPPAPVASASPTLPVTGGDMVALTGIGAGAVLAGAALVRSRRRLAPVD